MQADVGFDHTRDGISVPLSRHGKDHGSLFGFLLALVEANRSRPMYEHISNFWCHSESKKSSGFIAFANNSTFG